MRYIRYKNYNADFAFGLQKLRGALQTKAIGKLGAAKALSQSGLEKASKKALKGNERSMRLAARVGNLDKKLTSGVLGTDIGQLAKNARNNVANRLSNARKGLNKKAGILGTDVRDAKQIFTNRGQSSTISNLRMNNNKALAASNRPIEMPNRIIEKRKKQMQNATTSAKQNRLNVKKQLQFNPFMNTQTA